MDLIPFGGFDPFKQFSSFLRWDPFTAFSGEFYPRVDVKETDKEVIVEADIPGIDPKQINVEVGENSVKISASVKEEKEEKGKHFYRKERSSHSFHRMIALPCPVKEAGVKAASKNGILTITLPKKHPEITHKMKKIPIEEE